MPHLVQFARLKAQKDINVYGCEGTIDLKTNRPVTQFKCSFLAEQNLNGN